MKKYLGALGKVTAVIGAQWGDEGKGKIIDILAEDFDLLARASGGANAGHTIVVNGKKHIFHLLPSGCLHEGKPVILGSGMVIHLPTLLEEIETLKKAGIDILPRLKISHTAHIVFEKHKERDGKAEEQKGKSAIGTTKRGIGPTYEDKASRTGVRMEALLTEEDHPELQTAKKILAPCVVDTVSLLHDALSDGKTLLIEGAQGTMLDIDHGTYPYVTSSATTVTGALHALGLPPNVLDSCIGVVKAYCTRVGGGPFPTEIEGKRGDDLRERGHEYGATTGRPRRCGWLDLNDLKRAVQLNGFTHLNLTKLDVLDEEDEIPVVPVGALRQSSGQAPRALPLPGWQQSTKGMTSFEDLPKNAQAFIEHIEKAVQVSVSFIGTGPGREEMIMRE